MSRPAAFVDRDGCLNRRPGEDRYVLRPEALELLPHAAEGLRALRARGLALVVVTNQKGIGRGLMTEADLAAIHGKLERELAREGVTLDRIEHCPHLEGCACRKPAPGMLLRAARELDLDLARSLLIGDDPRDVAAARAAGVPLRILMPSDGDLRAAVACIDGGEAGVLRVERDRVERDRVERDPGRP